MFELTKQQEQYVRDCVREASCNAAWRFAFRDQEASDRSCEAGEEAAREAEIEGLGSDEVNAAYREAKVRVCQAVWTGDACGDDTPPGLIFRQPSESEYIQAAEEEAEREALATLGAERAGEREVCDT